jgi:hypothetical protein
MKRMTPISEDHQVILESLTVLRLIAQRVEAGDAVDPADIGMVVGFLRNVGCECLDHTASLILRPALERAKNRFDVQRLQAALGCHVAIRPLLDDTAADVEVFDSFFAPPPSRRTGTSASTDLDLFGEPDEEFPGSFLLHAKLLTKLVGDLILQEDETLLEDAVDLLSDPDGRLKIQEFVDQERRISAIAMEQSPTLHTLQRKYDRPNPNSLAMSR